ncbi:PGF-CTERM-anchored ABC transporter substrate-binding protein [Haloarchaeobius iranensis]|uniref:Iron complex transport system substrate-binding protein n=1 Tax=Haloarchaeobius iranensis TaxID=996166 RepID=A0A1G9TQD1_9EURY|nr:PGF-CTERM-anchored ABC transporter substrate-binding protein [Haloarchaeobius iranensis]SDM49986.1 iron complex transport system substrate-binding protein [Haloarchaeobius iranensis]
MAGTRTTLVVALLLVGSLAAVVAPVGGAAAPSAATNTASTAQEDCSFPFSATDATGTEVTVEGAPDSVVTLGPASAQTMVELGADANIVGATQYANYLDGSDSWANVSGSGRAFVSVERVVAEQPDLVLAENVVPDDTVERLRNAGVTVYKFRSANSMEFVYDKVNLTGSLVGACEGASETVEWMQTEVEVVQRAAEGQASPKALYVFYGSTPGPNTYISDLITTAGAENVVANADLEYTQAGYARINPEVVANLTVEWLLLNSGQPEPRVPDSPAYQNTVAVQENQTVVLNSNYVSQPAPRSVYVMRNLSQAWFPEAYAEANATVRGDASAGTTATATATATATDGGQTETSTPTTGSEDGGSPGFGVVAALVAALSLAGIAHRT